jgi:hypothetical protein
MLTTETVTSEATVEPTVTPDPTPADQEMSLPDFLKDAKDTDVTSNVQILKDFKDVETLAKSYIHAKKFVGVDKVAVPTKFAKDEEWTNLYKKLGLPETVDKYELQKDKDSKMDDEFFTNLKTTLHASGILPRQANNIAKFIDSKINGDVEMTKQVLEKHAVENETKLKNEWGDSFTARVSLAKDVVKTHGDDEFKQYISERGLQSDYHLVKFLSRIGEKMSGDSIAPRGESIGNINTPADAMVTLDNLRLDSAAIDPNHPNHRHVIAEMERLAKIAYSSK